MRPKEAIIHGINNAAHVAMRHRMHRINEAARIGGPPEGFRAILTAKNAPQVIWDNEEKTRDVISNGKPIILISNHPILAEPFVFLSALPSRRDVYLFAGADKKYGFGKDLGAHVFPILLPGIFETRRQRMKRQSLNAHQMEESQGKLREGSAVYIAPNPREGKWRTGVASLVETALEMDEAYLVMGNVQGSTRFEALRLLFNRKLERTLYISEPTMVQDLPISSEVRAMPSGDTEKLASITGVIQTYYENWEGKGTA